ncbi:MAG: hypothetical protein AB1896_23050, partial [Thermodesulfobacteriota bacterium]
MNLIRSLRQHSLKIGLIGGITVVGLSLIGMVEAFSQRDIIYQVISMGQVLLLMAMLLFCYLSAKRIEGSKTWKVLAGGLTGLVLAVFLLALVLLAQAVNMRAVFINASPVLFKILTFQLDLGSGLTLILAIGVVIGLLSAGLFLAPPLARRVVFISLGSLIAAGVLQDMIRPLLFEGAAAWFFTSNGLSLKGALSLCVVIALVMIFWSAKGEDIKTGFRGLPRGKQQAIRISTYSILILILLALPHILGLFMSEVLTIVGLFVLLGLGLNIVVGLAGLLDLGYVAFFAIG